MAKAGEVQVLRPGDSFEVWDRFVDESPQGCIFCRSWWLEAVSPGRFEVVTIRKGDAITAGMPVCRSRRWGMDFIRMPKMTQALGVLLGEPTSDNYEKTLSSQMALVEKLVEAVRGARYCEIACHYSFTNWLPFYWAGYEQTTAYTYVLEDITDAEKVFAGFAHSKRKNIKKAEAEVTVKEDISPEDLYANHEFTLGKQNDTVSYSYELFSRIYDASRERTAGKTWYAVDGQGNIHAAIFVVYDCKSAYYLISSIDPDYRNSGAATLLVMRAIEFVSKYTKKFDFEGSMIKGVEGSFRKFGAVQKPYFQIRKVDLPFLARMCFMLREARRKKAQG